MANRSKFIIALWAVLCAPCLAFSQINETKYHGGSYDGHTSALFTFAADRMYIPLSSGWSMISSNVTPYDPELSNLLASVSPNMVLMKDVSGAVYWPAQNITTLDEWGIKNGYLIYLTARDTLVIRGEPVVPEITPIGLSSGWNMISFLNTRSITPGEALSTVSSYLVIIKNSDGEVYWPAYNINTLGMMRPGSGYLAYVNQACVLTYPANLSLPKSSAAAPTTTISPAHFAGFRAKTPDNAIVLVTAHGLPDGAEIGAWTPSLLIGAGVVQMGRALLTLWGDDPLTVEVDGARTGESITLTCWDPFSAREQNVEYAKLTDGLTGTILPPLPAFQNNAVWHAELNAVPGQPEDFRLAQNFPNPFNPATAINFQLSNEAKVELMVINLSGMHVRTLAAGNKPAGLHQVIWNGRDDDNRPVPSGIYWAKLKAGDFTKTIKMILIK